MIVGFENSQIHAWRQDLCAYEHEKGKKNAGILPLQSFAEPRQISNQPSRFSIRPSYQQFLQSEQLKHNKSLSQYLSNNRPYEKPYDIVNLNPKDDIESKSSEGHKFSVKAPIRNLYNIINNSKLPEIYLKDRDIQLSQEKSLRLEKKYREFDIVTGKFKETHQQQKQFLQQIKTRQQIISRATQMKRDRIFSNHQNPESTLLKVRSSLVPPSYNKRQPYIQDYSKPLPQSVIQLDQKQANAKKRYRMKYYIEDECQQKSLRQESERIQIGIARVQNSHKAIQSDSTSFMFRRSPFRL